MKHCPSHGREEVLIADDIEYYRQTQAFIKPGDVPLRFNTPIKHGCPFDCGLCPDHEQHSCLTLLTLPPLIEVRNVVGDSWFTES